MRTSARVVVIGGGVVGWAAVGEEFELYLLALEGAEIDGEILPSHLGVVLAEEFFHFSGVVDHLDDKSHSVARVQSVAQTQGKVEGNGFIR